MAGYVLAVIGIFLGDLWIKDRIEGSDTDKSGNVLSRGREGDCRKPMTLAGGRIRIRKYHNEGAMLNLGQRRRKAVAALSVALTGAVGGMFLCSLGQRGNRLLRAGLALLLGGAFSNTYDRLKRRYVVDYLTFQVGWKPLGRVVFNLSDFAIMIGAMLAVLGASRDEG